MTTLLLIVGMFVVGVLVRPFLEKPLAKVGIVLPKAGGPGDDRQDPPPGP